jgi:subfamily B ATP-binding cassette protein MsbA
MMLFVFIVNLVALPMGRAIYLGTQVTEAIAGLDRIREIQAIPGESAPAAPAGAPIRGRVAFEGVSFHYVDGRPVLHEIDFRAEPGQTIALVGRSGAGKTTIFNLLMSFYRPDRGRITLDDRDLRALPPAALRGAIAMVLQDNFLFDGPVLENLLLARPGAAPEEVERACRLARCHEFIARLPGGYRAVIGERGVTLSGGERQRVAIARALLADPRVLLLDEATSHLDSENEALVLAGLRSLQQGRTTLVIAHRLSTVERADQILFLDHGRIVERGTYAELCRQDGPLAAWRRDQEVAGDRAAELIGAVLDGTTRWRSTESRASGSR